MIVIADTGPLNYLLLIGEIEVLPKLYRGILIPPAVRDELEQESAPRLVRQWTAHPPDWLVIRSPKSVPDAALLRARLGPGESEAILLAQEIGADELILDDLRGRKEASRRQLHFIGTLGILQAASKRGLLDMREAIDRLRRTNFHISEEVLDRLLTRERD
jgi:predicted nucleic acid-binding protein